jgi:hypothetical protein
LTYDLYIREQGVPKAEPLTLSQLVTNPNPFTAYPCSTALSKDIKPTYDNVVTELRIGSNYIRIRSKNRPMSFAPPGYSWAGQNIFVPIYLPYPWLL